MKKIKTFDSYLMVLYIIVLSFIFGLMFMINPLGGFTLFIVGTIYILMMGIGQREYIINILKENEKE